MQYDVLDSGQQDISCKIVFSSYNVHPILHVNPHAAVCQPLILLLEINFYDYPFNSSSKRLAQEGYMISEREGRGHGEVKSLPLGTFLKRFSSEVACPAYEVFPEAFGWVKQ